VRYHEALEAPMTISVTQIGPGFAARVDGADTTRRHKRLMQRTTIPGDPAELAAGSR